LVGEGVLRAAWSCARRRGWAGEEGSREDPPLRLTHNVKGREAAGAAAATPGAAAAATGGASRIKASADAAAMAVLHRFFDLSIRVVDQAFESWARVGNEGGRDTPFGVLVLESQRGEWIERKY